MTDRPLKRPVRVPESQRYYNAARTELVLAALTTEPRAFDDICETLGASSSVFDEGGYPITHGEVMIALHRLVKEGKVERTKSTTDTPSTYALAH
jgi:DNA-binding PadR family transcriptional regulator